jgi:hypothetical protein
MPCAYTHHGTTLQILTAGAILMGLTLLGLGGLAHLTGQVTGQGAISAMQKIPPATIVQATHAAAPIIEDTSTTAGLTIVLGMLLILIGLALHALLLLRLHAEKTVPVHSKVRGEKNVPRSARAQRSIEVFWVEEEIRL